MTFAAFAQTPPRDKEPLQRISVRVYDHAGVPDRVLKRAEAELVRRFVLVGVGVVRLTSRREFYTELWKHRPGEPVLLSLLRGGTPKAIEVVAGDRAEFYR